jgi:hypothetical protein
VRVPHELLILIEHCEERSHLRDGNFDPKKLHGLFEFAPVQGTITTRVELIELRAVWGHQQGKQVSTLAWGVACVMHSVTLLATWAIFRGAACVMHWLCRLPLRQGHWICPFETRVAHHLVQLIQSLATLDK